jgi:D-galactarolactone cycloisomerase
VPFRPDKEGYLTIPDRPGLGIELNREALKRFGA